MAATLVAAVKKMNKLGGLDARLEEIAPAQSAPPRAEIVSHAPAYRTMAAATA
jgi:hypothetical protein